MKKYIRTCLSLDKKTRDKAIDISMVLGCSMSEAIREGMKYFYDFISKMQAEEKEDGNL